MIHNPFIYLPPFSKLKNWNPDALFHIALGSIRFHVSRDSDEPSSGLLFSTLTFHPGELILAPPRLPRSGQRHRADQASGLALCLAPVTFAELISASGFSQTFSACRKQRHGGKSIWAVLDLWVRAHEYMNPGH